MSDKGAPVCTLLAGTNGSGKSSLYELLDPPGEFVNADVVAKQIYLQIQRRSRYKLESGSCPVLAS